VQVLPQIIPCVWASLDRLGQAHGEFVHDILGRMITPQTGKLRIQSGAVSGQEDQGQRRRRKGPQGKIAASIVGGDGAVRMVDKKGDRSVGLQDAPQFGGGRLHVAIFDSILADRSVEASVGKWQGFDPHPRLQGHAIGLRCRQLSEINSHHLDVVNSSQQISYSARAASDVEQRSAGGELPRDITPKMLKDCVYIARSAGKAHGPAAAPLAPIAAPRARMLAILPYTVASA